MTKLLSHSFNLAQFFFFLKDPVTRLCINNKRERSHNFRLHAREVQPKRRGPAQANENHKLITPKIWNNPKRWEDLPSSVRPCGAGVLDLWEEGLRWFPRISKDDVVSLLPDENFASRRHPVFPYQLWEVWEYLPHELDSVGGAGRIHSGSLQCPDYFILPAVMQV